MEPIALIHTRWQVAQSRPASQNLPKSMAAQPHGRKESTAYNRVAATASIYLTEYTSLTPELPGYVKVSHTAVPSDLEQFSLIPLLFPTNDTSYYSGDSRPVFRSKPGHPCYLKGIENLFKWHFNCSQRNAIFVVEI
jgi:hypothetical protein